MPAKFCLDCRQLTTNGSRCPDCQGARDAQLNARPKGNTTRRGLGAAHQRRARTLLSPPGLVCAICGKPGTPQDPLTAGHTVPRVLGGQDSDLRPEHRSCGSADGARLARTRSTARRRPPQDQGS